MDEITSTLPPNPRHVLMPSMTELSDADISDVGRWTPALCRVCRGSRTYVGYQPGSGSSYATYRCPCEEQLTLRRWFSVRGMPDSGMQLRWADMTGAHPEWISAAHEFTNRMEANLRIGQSMMFHGRSGSGKSSIAWLIMKAALWNNFNAHAVLATNIVDRLYMWRNDQDRLDRWNRKVRNCDLLVIDDLGKESGGSTEVVNQSIEALITRRADDRRSTLITTNLTQDQLMKRYPDSMESLRGGGSLVEMSLPDSWRDTDLMTRNRFEVEHNIARPAVWA